MPSLLGLVIVAQQSRFWYASMKRFPDNPPFYLRFLESSEIFTVRGALHHMLLSYHFDYVM